MYFVISNWIVVKFVDGMVSQLNPHQLMDLDFTSQLQMSAMTTLTQKTAATW